MYFGSQSESKALISTLKAKGSWATLHLHAPRKGFSYLSTKFLLLTFAISLFKFSFPM